MGFFYAKGSSKPKRSKHATGQRVARATPQNASTLQRLGCKVCPLNNIKVNSPKMKPTIADHTLVYFLAEAPGATEDEKGEPLIGKAGQLLRKCIPYEYKNHCAFDNIIRNRPPDNRDPTWQEIECCRNNVIESIEEAKPNLIVSLGKFPLHWVLKSHDIKGMRGRMFAVKIGSHRCWYMPTYHPSFILRVAYDRDRPFNTKFGNCFKMDLEKAFRFVERDIRPVFVSPKQAKKNIDTYTGSEDYEFGEVIDHIKAAIKSKYSAVDVETFPLKPYNSDALLLTTAISYFIKKEQKTFAFALEHKDAKWSKSQLSQIKGWLGKYLKKKKGIKIAHNVPFELEWFMYLLSIDIVDHHGWEDTMMQAQFIDERRGEKGEKPTSYQSLNFLCLLHFGLEIKSLFKLDMKNLKAAHIYDLLPYNGVDAKYELLLFMKQRKILKERKLLKAFKVAKDRQPTVALMHHFGIPVDQDVLKEHQHTLQERIDQLEGSIAKLKVIKQYEKDHGKFNPGSNPEVLVVFRDYLKRPEIEVAAKHGGIRYSVDKHILNIIDHPLAPKIVEFRRVSKLKSTYVDEFMFVKDDNGTRGKSVHDDGHLHAVFNTTFAETGRTSSDSPNMQNFPKRNDSWIRSSVVPGENMIFISADYGQLEWCTGCCCSLDKKMIDATWDGYDVHMEWAQRIGHIYPRIIGGKKALKDKKIMKKFRSRVKGDMVFPAMFGAMNDTIADYMKIPYDIMDDIMDDFWEDFNGLRDWQKELMKKYYNDGYVEAPNGRRRHYPLSKNQAINYPIQNAAADITCDSMVRLSEHAMTTNELHLHPILNIHDDLTFRVPDTTQIIEESIETMYKHMLDIPFDWVNVPISVEISIGYNWWEMDEVGKFYSNKDL